MKNLFWKLYLLFSRSERKYKTLAFDYWRDKLSEDKKAAYQKVLYAKTIRERIRLIKQL